MTIHSGRLYSYSTVDCESGEHFLAPLLGQRYQGSVYTPGINRGFWYLSPLLPNNAGAGRILRGKVIFPTDGKKAAIYAISMDDLQPPEGHDFEVNVDSLVRISQTKDTLFDSCVAVSRFHTKYLDILINIMRNDTGNEEHNLTQRTTSDPVLEFLGKGLRFPFTFQHRSGGAQISTATSSDHAHIHESIRQILGTKKGERFMRPEFGTRLHELVFEPNSRVLYGLIRHEVLDALEQWEPRIVVTDVLVDSDSADGHTVLVDIRYRLISSQVEGNLVWPFYRELE